MTTGLINGVLDIHSADDVYWGAIEAEEVYFGDARIWHKHHEHLVLDLTTLQGDVYLSWRDTISYQPAAGVRGSIYLEQGGKPLVYHRGPRTGDSVHYSTRALSFALTPDHGYDSSNTLFHVRGSADRRISANHDPTGDPILATIHFTPAPVIHLNGQHAARPAVHVMTQQEVAVDFGSWGDPDELFYWWNDDRQRAVPMDHIDSNLGAGDDWSSQIAVPGGLHAWQGIHGVHTFKFWNQGLGEHLSLHAGTFAPGVSDISGGVGWTATDEARARIVLS